MPQGLTFCTFAQDAAVLRKDVAFTGGDTGRTQLAGCSQHCQVCAEFFRAKMIRY